ncbi:LuxR C-terminal-related transcriptional regulator [Klebsiella aerogenes]|uniref:LuxR C-terminal-related transcriptional regulator n=1 Tax=Klebsiella aerogenes TaxID=548 RepID=UPI003964891F
MKVINNIKDIKFKRKLTNQEEIVIRLIMDGYDCENISKKMNLSIKTISLHKNKAKMKTGLLKNNDFTSFSLMKILFGSSSASYVPGHVGYTVSNTALI